MIARTCAIVNTAQFLYLNAKLQNNFKDLKYSTIKLRLTNKPSLFLQNAAANTLISDFLGLSIKFWHSYCFVVLIRTLSILHSWCIISKFTNFPVENHLLMSLSNSLYFSLCHTHTISSVALHTQKYICWYAFSVSSKTLSISAEILFLGIGW